MIPAGVTDLVIGPYKCLPDLPGRPSPVARTRSGELPGLVYGRVTRAAPCWAIGFLTELLRIDEGDFLWLMETHMGSSLVDGDLWNFCWLIGTLMGSLPVDGGSYGILVG